MDLRETYDRIAEDWAQDHANDDWWIGGTEKFASLIPSGGLILDVGCGPGLKSKFLLDRGFKVIGIDFSEKLLELARREAPGAEFRALDMREAGNLPETFDGIFAQASLLHIPKSETSEVMRGLASKLNPGGYFYVAVKQVWPGTPEEESVTERDYGYDYTRFFSYYTPEELEKYFSDIGLRIVHTEVSQGTSRTKWIQVIAQKP